MHFRFRSLLFVALSLAASCTYDPAHETTCTEEGAVSDGRVCTGGVWILTDGSDTGGGDTSGSGDVGIDAAGDTGGADAGDMGGGDMPCVPEGNVDFCSRLGFDCDEVTAADNCGVERTISCGTCDAPQTCGADGTPNVCSCVSETDAEFCTRLVKTCDDVTDVDNCGVSRTANCGACTAPATCGGGGTPNVCACAAQTDAQFCTDNGAVCGALTAVDECGQMRTTNCGTCMGPETCGAVTANQCDCPDDAAVCTSLMLECGTADVSASCGNKASVDCGGCQSNAACGMDNSCACNAGFADDGLGNCMDNNECALGTDNCDTNATCANTPGSFTCTCNAGYAGSGTSCSDVNECTAGTDNCDANATCTNSVGSFSCACNTGYTGDGVSCTDDDECALGTDNCDTNATCTNQPGTFSCACNSGYSGDGVTCTLNPTSPVVSVQTVSGSMSDGMSSGSVNLPTAINAANAIPFISVRSTSGLIRASTVDVVLSNNKADFSRPDATDAVEVVIAVVEFDPAQVGVQSGAFSAEGNQGITAVDTAKSFLTFAGSIDQNDDSVDNRMLSGHFPDGSNVAIGRSSTSGSLSGHYWVAEAKGTQFSVQHVSGALGASSTTTDLTIAATDLASSFIVYSYQASEPNSKFDRAAVSCELTAATTVTCSREGTGAGRTVDELHVQVVEVAGGSVQRGSTNFTGTNFTAAESVTAVTLAKSFANPGQTGSNGVCFSDEAAADGYPTVGTVVQLSSATTVDLRRASTADGIATCTWEVVEWP